MIFGERPSDYPFVERVWRCHSERAGTFHSIAAIHWEMVVTRHEGKTSITMRGPETKATIAECPAHGEWFAIRFKAGTFMPLFRPGGLRDRNDITLPNATSRSFWLNGSALEYPNFENAETFVKRLVHDGLIIKDPLVHAVLLGQPQDLTSRTEQRRFLEVTGLTRGTIHQIERARHATNLLKQGLSILDATYQAGYYDQAHFTRSMKRWIGQTRHKLSVRNSSCRFYTIRNPHSPLWCDHVPHNETIMTTYLQHAYLTTWRLWAGRIITGLVVIFLVFDGVTKIIQVAPVVEASTKLGLAPDLLLGIGIVLLACTAIYAVPKTAILGAILLTGYLGGATATHVRAGSEASPVVFSIVFGIVVWVALVLCEPRLFWLIIQRQYCCK